CLTSASAARRTRKAPSPTLWWTTSPSSRPSRPPVRGGKAAHPTLGRGQLLHLHHWAIRNRPSGGDRQGVAAQTTGRLFAPRLVIPAVVQPGSPGPARRRKGDLD